MSVDEYSALWEEHKALTRLFCDVKEVYSSCVNAAIHNQRLIDLCKRHNVTKIDLEILDRASQAAWERARGFETWLTNAEEKLRVQGRTLDEWKVKHGNPPNSN